MKKSFYQNLKFEVRSSFPANAVNWRKSKKEVKKVWTLEVEKYKTKNYFPNNFIKFILKDV
jgi:hypothetical protein